MIIYFTILEKMNIPVGYCHGDLTLSNILINPGNRKLYLIDFLDNFVETPLQDIVKLRQDTYFFWTLSMCNFKFDKIKITNILYHFDKIISQYFQKYNFYKYYKYFQILNLLRVLQYSKNKKIIESLTKYIYELLDTN